MKTCNHVIFISVSDEPTLSIAASIGMIIAIICSAFSVFALITAVATNKEVYEEKEKAKSHALVGMILLIIAGKFYTIHPYAWIGDNGLTCYRK